MSLRIESTTDSEADVKSALGNQTRLDVKAPVEAKVSEERPVTEKPVEKVAADSGTAEGEGEKSPEPGKVEGSKNLDKRFAKLTRQRKEAEAKAEENSRMAAYWENKAKKFRDSVKPEPKVETKAE